MHFAVELVKLRNFEAYTRYANQIGNYKMFYEVVLLFYKGYKLYQNKDGSPNIPMLKDEAIGKLLTEVLMNKTSRYTDRPELLVQVKSWWQGSLEWLKAAILRIQIDPSRRQ